MNMQNILKSDDILITQVLTKKIETVDLCIQNVNATQTTSGVHVCNNSVIKLLVQSHLSKVDTFDRSDQNGHYIIDRYILDV